MTLHQLSESALRDTLTVKERGTANVLHALAQRNLLDERLLLLFCNSLAAVNAEIGQTGYATASAYLDALAQQLRTRYKVNALSIGLDALREQGMLLDAINGSEYDVLRGLRPLMTGTLLQAYKQQGADTSYYARLSPSPIGCWMSTGYPVSPRCREPAIWRWRMKLCAITLCKTKSALMNWSFGTVDCDGQLQC